ncbi:FMN-binding protein [Thalassotalea atypica]|uniref:FMN-binding protein n=1 Tax=Thalassotalea atypica TaxID=2054316 RepID=UPI0025747136|nr:FMN-binding protein [Thalassotalea atypica]
MLRRQFIKSMFGTATVFGLPIRFAYAKTYLTIEQAKQIIWPNLLFSPSPITLTDAQAELIEEKSDIRVRNLNINAWKNSEGDWFIVDQVIGKHENIDIAVGLDNKGKVVGIEVLTYRETYGDQIMNPKWRAQFHGKDSSEHLKLDHQIKNISGATLSCRHVTDGINRLTQTWDLVLKHV